MDIIAWPARSPDLNQIKNLWAIVGQRVYNRGKQYSPVAELTRIIVSAWESIESSILRSLIDSMPRRCREVIETN